jgi:hypothetical protein
MKGSLLARSSYYKLRVGEHFVHNVSGQRRKSYGASSIEEIIDQVLMVLRVISS